MASAEAIKSDFLFNLISLRKFILVIGVTRRAELLEWLDKVFSRRTSGRSAIDKLMLCTKQAELIIKVYHSYLRRWLISEGEAGIQAGDRIWLIPVH